MNVYSNILELVGKTPMLEVTNIDTGPCRLFLKLELMNPGGSIKDQLSIDYCNENGMSMVMTGTRHFKH